MNSLHAFAMVFSFNFNAINCVLYTLLLRHMTQFHYISKTILKFDKMAVTVNHLVPTYGFCVSMFFSDANTSGCKKYKLLMIRPKINVHFQLKYS